MADRRVAALLAEVGLPADAADNVAIEGSDPVYASPFPVASLAAVALGAVAATAGLIWRDKTGIEQQVAVDTRKAGASLLSFVFQQLIDGETPQRVADNPLIALYECRDGGWVHLHGAFPGLADATRRVLGIWPRPRGRIPGCRHPIHRAARRGWRAGRDAAEPHHLVH